MAEQFEHQQEQENLSGMSDYLHHTYTQSGVKFKDNKQKKPSRGYQRQPMTQRICVKLSKEY
jgi:hypothetical protein